MQPPEKINTKGALFVRMLIFEKYLVSISLNKYMPLENRKRKKMFILGTIQPIFEQVYTS